jgi:predicted PhzF superfamily epimerase YddE/YHI9
LMPGHYSASQGVCMGRAGEVDLQKDTQGQVWVGGKSVTCISGMVTL